MRTGQPPSGAGPATRMSPPRLIRTPPPVVAHAAVAARSAASALAVAPRSTRAPPHTDPRESRDRRLADGSELGEVAVVAGALERVGERRVYIAPGQLRRTDGGRHRIQQQAADGDGLPACRVELNQLAVVAEAAASFVEGAKLGLNHLAHAREVARSGDQDRDIRAEGAPVGRCRPLARLHADHRLA